MERFTTNVQTKLIPNLKTDCDTLEIKVTEAKFLTKECSVESNIAELEKYKAEYLELEGMAKKINKYEETLNLATSGFENVYNLGQEVNLRLDLWKSLKEFHELSEKWISGKFNDIDADEIRVKGDYYTKIVLKCTRGLPANPALNELRDMVFKFKETMPIVLALRNSDINNPQHMGEIKLAINKPDFEINDELTLRDLINMNIVVHQ